MTIDDCIDAYVSLSDRVFQKTKSSITLTGRARGKFDIKKLEEAIKEIIVKSGLEVDALLDGTEDSKCKV